jgi:hypothetical protein
MKKSDAFLALVFIVSMVAAVTCGIVKANAPAASSRPTAWRRTCRFKL